MKPSGKIKEKRLRAGTYGFPYFVCYSPSASGCYLAQLRSTSIKWVLISLLTSFLLTALPSLSGAILRVPYSFMVPIMGGRYWTVISTVILVIPCLWLGLAVQNPTTRTGYLSQFRYSAVLPAPTSPPVWATSASSSPRPNKAAHGINGGLGNLGVSVMQLVSPIFVFLPILPFWAFAA